VQAEAFSAEIGKTNFYQSAKRIAKHDTQNVQKHIIHITVPPQEKLAAFQSEGIAETQEKSFSSLEVPEQQRREKTKGKKCTHVSKEHDNSIGQFTLPESLEVV
jgi:hypothetical protein